MFFFDIFYIRDNDTFTLGKRIVPPFYYVHIYVLQSAYFGNHSLRTPFIRIVCAMPFFTIFENIYSVRTDMSAEKADKFIDLLVRCMVIECGSKCFIYDQFILYDCFLVVFLLNVFLILFFTFKPDGKSFFYLLLFHRFHKKIFYPQPERMK